MSDSDDPARRAGAQQRGVDPDQISLGDPVPLDGTGCTLYTYWESALVGDYAAGVVVLPDGTAITGGSDESFGQAVERCYRGQSTLPSADNAMRLVLHMAAVSSSLTPSREVPATRVLKDEYNVDWEPPSVVATTDGFVVTFVGVEVELARYAKVTTTYAGGSAETRIDWID